MNTVTKLFAALFLIFMSVACQDGKMDVVENIGIKNHDNARTNTITDVPAGTTTLTGSHDVIRIANGANLKLADGVTWNSFDWSLYSTSGTATYITVETSATVHSNQSNLVPVGVIFYNRGNLYNHNQPFQVLGTFNNYKKHVIDGILKLSPGSLYNNLLGADILEAYMLDIHDGRLSFTYTTATFHDVKAIIGTTLPALTGAGKVKIYQGDVYFGRLADTQIKVCMTGGVLNYYGGATLGGTPSCL